MKKSLWIGAGIVVVLAVAVVILNYYSNKQKQENIPMNQALQNQPAPIQPVQVIPVGHASLILEWAGSAIYADPIGEPAIFQNQSSASIILVTDIHGDHFSTSTLAALLGANASLVVPQAVKDELPTALATRAKVLDNGEAITINGFNILAIPMYNLPGTENSKYHTKGRGNGYVIEKDGFRVYIAGDTAGTPEMRALKDINIAFVPMNLPYTMSVDEAASAVLEFKPQQVYPYHYRGADGPADVSRFKELVNAGNPGIGVVLGNWYP